ncbi:MAG: phosphoglucosamine mutase [Lentisphaerota bacterium]
MKQLFGTDGIRGKANTYPITPEIALQLGKALGRYFKADREGYYKAVIGKDTRLSGYMLESAIESGLVSMGMDAMCVGPLPTPAIARLVKSFNANCGVMITASHNPYEDNGIKLFGPDGFKLPDAEELKIEKIMFSGEINSEHVVTKLLGKAHRIEDAKGRYVEFAKSTIKDHSLKGLKIVLDCANGAGYCIAPWIFRELGAEVIKVATEPDGLNINKNCGAMYPSNISNLIREHQADAGICLDGDADRVIMLDSNGAVVNGDRILAMCALDFKERNRLSNDTLVTTVMSNLGLKHAMQKAGINMEITQVGDRYVIEKMRDGNFNLGGEQSGHIIFMDYVTTGDGIITALHVLRMMLQKQAPLAELANCMDEFPQKLVNLKVKEKLPIEEVPELDDEIKKCQAELKDNGRVLVRYSGTENLLRIMIEAKTYKLADSWLKKITAIAEKKLK